MTATLAISLIKAPPLNRKRIILLSAISILFILTICAFFVKTDSTRGRLLIYKISYQIFKDYLWTGTGWGKFGSVYLSYQCDYFSEKRYEIKELLLADNTRYAFNDYLQFGIEGGIRSIALMISALCALLNIIKAAIKINPEKPEILLFSLGQLVCLLTAALFTHLFEQLLFQALFFLCLVILIRYLNPGHLKRSHFISIIIVFVLCISPHYSEFALKKLEYNAELSEAKELYRGGFTNESRVIYERLYRNFSEDLQFLKDYLKVLRTTPDNLRKEQILKQVVKLDNSNIYHLELALYYQRLKKKRLAESEYLKAVYTVPNRFVTRSALLAFYIETQQNEKAVQTARELLTLPIKVPSERVDLIRANAKSTLLKSKLSKNGLSFKD